MYKVPPNQHPWIHKLVHVSLLRKSLTTPSHRSDVIPCMNMSSLTWVNLKLSRCGNWTGEKNSCSANWNMNVKSIKLPTIQVNIFFQLFVVLFNQLSNFDRQGQDKHCWHLLPIIQNIFIFSCVDLFQFQFYTTECIIIISRIKYLKIITSFKLGYFLSSGNMKFKIWNKKLHCMYMTFFTLFLYNQM